VVAIIPLQEMGMHQLFGPDDAGWTTNCTGINFFVQVLHNYSYSLWIYEFIWTQVLVTANKNANMSFIYIYI